MDAAALRGLQGEAEAKGRVEGGAREVGVGVKESAEIEELETVSFSAPIDEILNVLSRNDTRIDRAVIVGVIPKEHGDEMKENAQKIRNLLKAVVKRIERK